MALFSTAKAMYSIAISGSAVVEFIIFAPGTLGTTAFMTFGFAVSTQIGTSVTSRMVSAIHTNVPSRSLTRAALMSKAVAPSPTSSLAKF